MHGPAAIPYGVIVRRMNPAGSSERELVGLAFLVWTTFIATVLWFVRLARSPGGNPGRRRQGAGLTY